jgi:hypothetical protein
VDLKDLQQSRSRVALTARSHPRFDLADLLLYLGVAFVEEFHISKLLEFAGFLEIGQLFPLLVPPSTARGYTPGGSSQLGSIFHSPFEL